MKNSNHYPKSNLLVCILAFFIIESFLLVSAFLSGNRVVNFAILFVAGWLLWTFTEYGIHRFLMHELIVPGKKDDLFYHQIHHQNPGNLKVGWKHRILISILGTIILWIALYLNNGFTFFAGFFIGFLFYNLLHFFLHRPIGGLILPNIQRAHILHHTRYPNCGYSFSTILWDWIFGTLPPKDAVITDHTKKNYFNPQTKELKSPSAVAERVKN